MLSAEKKRRLVRDIHRMLTLGTVHTLQLYLGEVTESMKEKLKEYFTDSTSTGILRDNVIYIEQAAGVDPLTIEESIIRAIELTEGSIEGVSFYTEMMHKGQSVFVVIEYNLETHKPELLSADAKTNYFELVQLINTKWIFSDRYIVD